MSENSQFNNFDLQVPYWQPRLAVNAAKGWVWGLLKIFNFYALFFYGSIRSSK